MCLIDRFNKNSLIMKEIAIVFAIEVIHVIFGFVMIYQKFTKFDIYNLFDSSPLFGFSIGTNCHNQEAVVFHHWGGFSSKIVYNNEEDIFIYGDADIKWINGYCFCYRGSMSFRI